MLTLKQKLADVDARVTMHICTIPSATVTQAIAAAGSDSICIDFEHGAVDYASAHAMIAATAGTGCAPLVRVAENKLTDVKKALDLGAEGIVFPMIRTVVDAENAVASMRYPPIGRRGFGPFMAHSRWGVSLLDYRDMADGNLVCILLIETREAVENIEAICDVPGIDVIIPAPYDLSTDLGITGQFDHPDFLAAVARVEKEAGRAGIPLGSIALEKSQADTVFAKGYRLIAGVDVLWMTAKAVEAQSWTK